MNEEINDEINDERIFHTVIKDICKDEGINVKKLSYNWILELKKDNMIKHIVGNNFDLNSESAGKIACDKYATYEILKSNNVNVINHQILFNPLYRSSYIFDDGNYNSIIKYFNDSNKKLVIKPNTGCKGKNIYLCNTLKETDIAINKLFNGNTSISLCPYYDIKTEYRTFYLDGEVLLVYGKIKPYVIGNGKSSINELINKKLSTNKLVIENHIDLNYIPKNNEKIELSWKHNLSGGATPNILDNCILKDNIINLAKKAAKALNITFATIDVIQTIDNELLIMEVNSGVCMSKFIDEVDNGYEIAKEIYKKAIKKLFEKE